MKIGAINNARITPSFGRRLQPFEQEGCKIAIQQGLKLLDKDLAIILPTNCSPSNSDNDIGIGQPYTAYTSEKLYPFLANYGFTAQQTQPLGLNKLTDPSPYVSNSSAYNTLIIDLESLTKPESGALLSRKTYHAVTKNNLAKGSDRADFFYAIDAHSKALNEAYEAFLNKKENIDKLSAKEKKAISELDKEFNSFVKKHGEEQKKNALYNVLTKEHGNDYWPNWNNEIDRNLFDKNFPDKNGQKARIKELETKHKKDIDSFMFSQMLAKKSLDEGRAKNKIHGIKTIGDIPVAFSDAEIWAHKDLFLPTMRMGCQEPWNVKDTQKWGFWILDPKKMFNNDGTLGEAGKFLYDKYDRAFSENKGGVRIDHVLGLMNPYVYEDGGNTEGRLYDLPQYKGMNGVNYDRILDEIVLKAAANNGIDRSSVIVEDLGYMPDECKVGIKKLGVTSIKLTQYDKDSEIWDYPKESVAMIGSHDNPTAKEIYPNKDARRAKFAELFSSGAKHVQIFWTDLFGIRERYNDPHASGGKNWSLRMTDTFEDDYYAKLEQNDALNLPGAIYEANERKDSEFKTKNPMLAHSLEYYSAILKQPEKQN